MAAKKATKEELERRAAAAALASQSQYNIIIPCMNAEFAYIKEPSSIKRPHLSTRSDRFLSIAKEYSEKGYLERLVGEMSEFAKTEPKWNDVIAEVKKHCGAQE